MIMKRKIEMQLNLGEFICKFRVMRQFNLVDISIISAKAAVIVTKFFTVLGWERKSFYCLWMSLLFEFLPGKKTVKTGLPGITRYSCILGSGKQITLPGK